MTTTEEHQSMLDTAIVYVVAFLIIAACLCIAGEIMDGGFNSEPTPVQSRP